MTGAQTVAPVSAFLTLDPAQATEQGLTTTPGPKTPSKPLGLSHFHRLLQNPNYKGQVRYNGVTYPGKHTPLVSEDTWDKVQELLESKGRSGEKQRKHHHYLKGTVFCGRCRQRLLVSNNRGRRGTIYPTTSASDANRNTQTAHKRRC